ncbi:MAG TPA: hypothetical protein VG253_07705 [Streptosporangiaceae bacterium]|nr:hypothetical protein [Streptosporangiaceae bacterium]
MLAAQYDRADVRDTAAMAAGDYYDYPDVRMQGRSRRRALSKVPEVTVYFWIVKILTTFVGEATSDYLVHTINPYVAVGLGFVGFVAALTAQFATRRYVPWIYWSTVAMVAVFGTMAADVLHVAIGVPYVDSTALFLVVLAVVFLVWYRSEGTLSIHSIYTPRREVFYWAAVVTAFALGTAAGDLAAKSGGFGYLGSGLIFTAVIALPAIAYWGFDLNAIAAFWFAYIVTRPVGASFADWMGFPKSVGGLGIGHGPVALVSAAVLVCFIAYLTVSRRDVPRESG